MIAWVLGREAAKSPTPRRESEATDCPLASPPAGADMEPAAVRRRWMALCFLLTLAIYVALVPRFLLYSSPPTGDQPFYLMDTLSLVQDHDLNVANNYQQHDEDKFYGLAPHPPDFVGMSAPYPLPPQLANTVARPPTEQYAFHLPGLSILLVPAWIIGSWFLLWWPATIVFMCLVGALVGLNVFLLAYEVTSRAWIAWAVWLPMAFSSPIMSYSYLIFTELTTGLLLVYAFRLLARGWGSNGALRLSLIGLCLGYIPLLAWRCAPLAVALGLYAAVQWWRYRRSTRAAASDVQLAADGISNQRGDKGSVLWLAWTFMPAVISAALIVAYNLFLFNKLVPDNRVPELGDRSPFHWPWGGIGDLVQFATTAFGLLFDQEWGLLIYSPLYLLAAAGMIALFRSCRSSDRRLLLSMALVALPYLTMITSFEIWNGLWCPPARYLSTFVPLLAAPLAMSLHAGGRVYRAVYGVMALPGFFFMAIMMNDARLMFNHPVGRASIFNWLAVSPEAPIHFDLTGILPAFVPSNKLTHPMTSGWIVTVSVLIVLLCYLLMRPRLDSWRAPRWTWAAQGATWLGAVSVIGLGWFAMNHDYLQHKTQLVQQMRWDLTPLGQAPTRVAYLDGKVYLASYDGAYVGELDTSSGSLRAISPLSPSGVLTYTHPGEVKVGPDNLLYVLNNGPKEQALYVMKSDGQVVRQIALNGVGNIATGLDFGANGELFVSDVVGGAIFKYGPTGGEPLKVFTDQDGHMNNPQGIAVDKDGMLYVTETYPWIIQIDADNHFVRRLNTGCEAKTVAIEGDWLDASCAHGLVSINKKTGEVQQAQVAGNSPQLASPSGSAYGPDNTLYVIDGNMLVVYKVEH